MTWVPVTSRQQPRVACSKTALEYLEMRFGGPHCEAVDRQHVLRTGRERDNAVDLGAQRHIAAWCADRRPDLDTIAVDHRNIHEQVQRRRGFRRFQPKCFERSPQIVGAVVVTDLRSLSVREAARQIADRRLTAEALVSAYLDRIEAREAVVGAWEYLDRDQALAAARRRDAEPPRGPLHGIPIAVKDLIDTVNMPTAYGSPIYRGHRPAADASCVALARAAGAVVLGKTVTTEFATFTPINTASPRNPAHTPGGSSSGC